MGYALIENFIDANTIVPISEQQEKHRTNEDKTTKSTTILKLTKLTKVTYPNLWEGITESFFDIKAGANVNNIKLQYNTKISVPKDGSLKFTLFKYPYSIYGYTF